MRRAKIICTIGPASESEPMIKELCNAGMDVARINFSHGTQEVHSEVIEKIRNVSYQLSKPLTIMQDLQGPKIRIGTFLNGNAQLVEGQIFKITTRETIGTSEIASTNYKGLPQDLKQGDNILLNDGMISLEVNDKSNEDIVCKVIRGGMISDHKGINLPNIKVGIPFPTEKDLEDLMFGMGKGVDYFAVSFVRTGNDVKAIKDIIKRNGKSIPVIAKIEKPEAFDNLDEILNYADGVMIARGDLGVEISPEKVPVMQKLIIERANRRNRIVITATEMLESMIKSARPTRAEASDVANAIFDGTDCLMLSGETAIGRYPIDAVKMMSRIIEVSEASIKRKIVDPHENDETNTFTDAVCYGSIHAAQQTNATAIACFTQSGETARLLSNYRPGMPIIAFTPIESVFQKMGLYWGVIPERMPLLESTDKMINELENRLKQKGIAKNGDRIVIIMGPPVTKIGSTNMMKLHKIGE